jgi:hypothetical protein
MSLKPLFFLLLSTTAPYSILAQQKPGNDTVLKSSTIEVIQAYKPEVKQAPKPEWIPQLPPADTSHPAFSYDIPQQTLYYTYSSLPLRPLALGKDLGKPPFKNYVKVGSGNLSTLFFDAGIASLAGKDYETDIHLHHISQKGQLSYQQSALSGMEAEGVLHKGKNDWHAALITERNQYYYYGYDHSLPYNTDNLKQVYTTIRIVADLKNRPAGIAKSDSTARVDSLAPRNDSLAVIDSPVKENAVKNDRLSYNPAVNASLYNAKFNTSEITLGLNAPLAYRIDSTLDFNIALTGAFTDYNTNTGAVNNNYIEAQPGISIHGGALYAHAMLGLALGKGSAGYLLPDLLVAYKIGNKFTASAGWQAFLRQNTYEQLTTENPFLVSSYTVMQSHTQEIFLDLQGNSGDHLSFSGRLSWLALNTLPTFLNDSGDHKQFYVDYQDVNAISVKGAIRYHVANTWSAGLTGDFYSFFPTEQYAWHLPTMKIKGDFMIMPVRKLIVTAYLALLGGIYVKDYNHNPVKLSTIADIGGNIEYQMIPRLSVFLQVNNLFNDKYQRWYGYQAYGLNIYGGIRLKF